MSVSALTPPNASEMFSSLRIVSPIRRSLCAIASPSGHLRASRPATTAASSIRRSAATMPLRPSSNLTSVSMCWTFLPPYSASISTAYFSATKPRRTLRVRVSSSSSGSSSLCRIRKRWICDAGSAAVAGELGVDLLDALLDQLVDLGLGARGRCSPNTRCRAARPSCRPSPMSMLMNAHTMSRLSPNATASLMCGKNLSLFSR